MKIGRGRENYLSVQNPSLFSFCLILFFVVVIFFSIFCLFVCFGGTSSWSCFLLLSLPSVCCPHYLNTWKGLSLFQLMLLKRIVIQYYVDTPQVENPVKILYDHERSFMVLSRSWQILILPRLLKDLVKILPRTCSFWHYLTGSCPRSCMILPKILPRSY